MSEMLHALRAIDPELAGEIAAAYQTRNRREREDPAFAAREPRQPAERKVFRPPIKEGPPSYPEAHKWDRDIAFYKDVAADVAEAATIKGIFEVNFQHRYARQPNALQYTEMAALRLSRYEWREVFTLTESRSDKYQRRKSQQREEEAEEQKGKFRIGEVGEAEVHAAMQFEVEHVPVNLIMEIARGTAKRRKSRNIKEGQLNHWRTRGELPSASACEYFVKNMGQLPEDEDDEALD